MGLSTFVLGRLTDAQRRDLLSHGVEPAEIARLDAPNDSGGAAEKQRPSRDGERFPPLRSPFRQKFHRA